MDQLRESPRPPMSRASLVLGVYGAMAIGAIVLSAGRGDADVYRLVDERRPLWLLVSPVAGLLVGLAFVALTRMAVVRFAWAQAMHRSFHDLLGPLRTKDILLLAAASSIGEEFLFRGALQPWLGVLPQAALFALLHIGPGRRFLPWTLSALAMGVAFGMMSEISGNLGGAIVAHFTINFLNLRHIVANPGPHRVGMFARRLQ
jgi:membrane protease YdiL (CAAX protease family)